MMASRTGPSHKTFTCSSGRALPVPELSSVIYKMDLSCLCIPTHAEWELETATRATGLEIAPEVALEVCRS